MLTFLAHGSLEHLSSGTAGQLRTCTTIRLEPAHDLRRSKARNIGLSTAIKIATLEIQCFCWTASEFEALRNAGRSPPPCNSRLVPLMYDALLEAT